MIGNDCAVIYRIYCLDTAAYIAAINANSKGLYTTRKGAQEWADQLTKHGAGRRYEVHEFRLVREEESR